MRYTKWPLFFLLIVGWIVAGCYYFFTHRDLPDSSLVLEAEAPVQRVLAHEIHAAGTLVLRDQMKIGSLVAGRIKAVHVRENDEVKKGQLLIEMDTGFEDIEVREAMGLYERAKAELDFQEAIYHRQHQLSRRVFIPQEVLFETRRNYQAVQADVKALRASYEKKLIALQHCQIRAPSDGTVIQLHVSEGEHAVSELKRDSLITLVPDINQIEAELEINEKDIGHLKKGQVVRIFVDTYPDQFFESIIDRIKFTPVENRREGCLYQAEACLQNPKQRLRPGMSIRATIDIDLDESDIQSSKF